MYASLPAILYLNASIAKFRLNPTLDFHSRKLDKVSFAMSDLGQLFPKPSPAISSSDRGVEDTASMLIMVLAHAMYSGDGALISRHYPLLKKWADYLADHVSDLGEQLTSDTSINAGQDSVNLALKGIIGVKAMSKMSEAFGISSDADWYGSSSQPGEPKHSEAGVCARASETLRRAGSSTISTYADKLLRLNLVDDAAYQAQAAFYQDLISGSSGKAGLPAVTGNAFIYLDWNMFAAATVNESSIRDTMIARIHDTVNNNSTGGSFGNPRAFEVKTGKLSGPASAAMGAMLSVLALGLTNQTITRLLTA
ncbi:hypothetical protein HGRIS_006783 [Hohenbuehelia grisea]|uniref:Glutaminase A central domain-containing protein n=1 Tax=Hohenbuehelia grisea TaxID=104357 RepID=A0ABR3JAD5_9AGAR